MTVVAESEKQKATFGLDENIASAICYLFIWVTGLIFYLVEKDNKMVKFHALQSIITFLPLQIIYWLLWYVLWWTGITYFLTMFVGLIMFILWRIANYPLFLDKVKRGRRPNKKNQNLSRFPLQILQVFLNF